MTRFDREFKWKLWLEFERTRGRAGIFSFVMLLYLFVVESNYPIGLTVGVVFGLMFLTALMDWRWILSKEQEWKGKKHPVMMETLENTVKILKRLERIERGKDKL